MKQIVIEWIKEAIKTFGFDLEGCFCDEKDEKKKREVKEALEEIIKNKTLKQVQKEARKQGHCHCNITIKCPCHDFISFNKCRCLRHLRI